eukprot:TRINITY_DN57443_c0_g1_i1.p1 TRINITY_DN57443_c0_g1~~TRINITY_DN57443_c0_g1_i1.p1  ORF type:complete len:271 (+),score=22.34 TRINITY_DN57443_c0_g1_i1:92-904(+)
MVRGSLIFAFLNLTLCRTEVSYPPKPSPVVKVELFTEIGCKSCRRFLRERVGSLMGVSGLAKNIDVQISSFGNSYFVTQQCGGSKDKYESDVRICYSKLCGARAEVGSRPSDCFTGEMVCQHGPKECIGNRYSVCAKEISKANKRNHMMFLMCLEANYEPRSQSVTFPHVVNACARRASLDMNAIEDCHNSGLGTALTIAEALKVPGHVGVPWILIDGQPLTDHSAFFDTLCDLHANMTGGSPPKGCRDAKRPVSFTQVVGHRPLEDLCV